MEPEKIKTKYGNIIKTDKKLIIKYNNGEVEGFIKDNILNENMRQYFELLLIIGLGVIYFTTDITIIDGISMEPTFKNHQLILKTKFKGSLDDILLSKNTIVKFKSPTGETSIKRIVAGPGDEIEFDCNRMKINGKILNNTLVGEHPSYGVKKQGYSMSRIGKKRNVSPFTTTITLSKDQYYLLGDNRFNSIDSRDYGPISKGNIISIVSN